ncbi:MAG TPA: hypothetical protein VG406_09675 [Isosphaeraceae bacterium]|nr:hypothetical protein [Isosphaeraceae bacterium]
MSRGKMLQALVIVGALAGAFGAKPARAQDWTNYLQWPYTPPQVPGNGFQYQPLYDRWYLYPRDMRIKPQIQGPYYRNWYGGKRILGIRSPHGLHDWYDSKKFYYGYHFALDVF